MVNQATAADTLINNDYRRDCCPCCASKSVSKIGDISYGNEVRFSSHPIGLKLTPELWKCENCKSGFIQNILHENTATELYTNGIAGDRWSKIPMTEKKPKEIISSLKRYFLEGKSVLDIGCNTGELLDFAKSRGCITSGVELSKDSQLELISKGHQVYCSIAKASQNTFDVVTAFDLVEHLYDINGFLESCKSLLKQNGVLIIMTGDILSLSSKLSSSKWWYVSYPEHVVFPSTYFFKKHSGFKSELTIFTYAANAYRHSLIKVAYMGLRYLIKRLYRGLPSIGADHILVVLKKN